MSRQDPPTVDPVALRREAEQLVSEAEKAVTDAQEAARELLARAELAEAEHREAERQGAWLVAVVERRRTLAEAVAVWEEAGRDLDAVKADRDEARALVARAEADRAAAWEELEQALADTDLVRIRAADIARAASEHTPELLAPNLKRAEDAVTRAAESLKWCAVAVQECWEALGRLGREALLEDVDRPAALPPVPEPMIPREWWERAQREWDEAHAKTPAVRG